MTGEEIIQQEEELTKIEARAIDSYIEDIYSKKVPEPSPPSKKDLSFWKIAGIEATLFTVAGIAIAIYSAIRTGGLFYIMETLLLREFGLPEALVGTFSLSAMITSLGAFELYVLADGFSKGKENKNLKRSEIGLYASLGVIVLAGIFTGLGLVPNLNDVFKAVFYAVIAVITAISGGLVALYSGENIGYTVLRVDKVREKLLKAHADNYQKWKEGGIKSYQTSRYAVGSKKANEFIENLNKQKFLNAEKNIEKNVTTVNVDSLNDEFDSMKTVFDSIEENTAVVAEKIKEDNEAKENVDSIFKGMEIFSESVEHEIESDSFMVYDKIVKFVKTNRRLPRVKELDGFGEDKLKTYIALSKFIMNYKSFLLKTKIISEEEMKRAEKYLLDNQNVK